MKPINFRYIHWIWISYSEKPWDSEQTHGLVPQKFLVLHLPVKTDDTPTLRLSFRSECLGSQNLNLLGEEVGGAPSKICTKGLTHQTFMVSLLPLLSQLLAAATWWHNRYVTIKNNLAITIFCHHWNCISGIQCTLYLDIGELYQDKYI